MTSRSSAEIRSGFLEFFKGRGHTVVGSDLLVPKNDPTLLFTGAGMNQFKEQFMGGNITFKRAASCQKCLRTGDLENVGKTPRHHTFFEMLGNFSFGDYFKKDAISWAWEFMTEWMALPKKKLWVSVYEKDEESYLIWLNDVKVPAEKIVKLGPKDNFWPADAPKLGPNGPCGPCSEIFYDRGKDSGCPSPSCDPSCDCGRFVEVWNLVFTEFERKPDGSLVPLPNKNIDTGMGLERIASVAQGTRTNFGTDLFTPIIEQIRKGLGPSAKDMPEEGFNLMADHIRAAVFAIADGVSPSNEKRGYVVRKLIRRAYLRGGKGKPFLYDLVPTVASVMKEAYPELEEKREHISAIVEEEEKKFGDTLSSAMPVFDGMVSGGSAALDGEQIFRLVDTYGLPVDVITEKALERRIALDMDGFKRLMRERKEQSRRGSDISSEYIFQPDHFVNAPNPPYSGDMPLGAELEFMVKEDKPSDEIREGDRAEVMTSPQSSVFYSEAGGQAGDSGTIVTKDGRMNIVNTFEVDGKKVFQVSVEKGVFKKNDTVTVDLDGVRKKRTAGNHTATHLLQAALRCVLGAQVKQSGSMVDDRRLRFDFTHMKKMSDRELLRVEETVNGWISEGIDVSCRTRSLKEAKEEGALSFFGEKYGDTVRVVSVGAESKELCGGTHVDNTRDIGVVKIISESSVASGIRRIEALTGNIAKKWIKDKLAALLDDLRAKMPGEKTGLDEKTERYAEGIINGTREIGPDVIRDLDEKIIPRIMDLKGRIEKDAKKRQKDKESDIFDEAKREIDKMTSHPDVIGGINFISGILQGVDMSLLRKAVGHLEKKASSAVILLGSSKDDKAYLICAVTPDLTQKGIDAKEMLNAVAGNIAGSGGGKSTFAQAGGSDPDGLPKAVEEAKRIIERKG